MGSEGESKFTVAEQTVQTRPIKAQSTAIARAMARICNAEWVCLGGMRGHGGFALTLSGLKAATPSAIPPAHACLVDQKTGIEQGLHDVRLTQLAPASTRATSCGQPLRGSWPGHRSSSDAYGLTRLRLANSS